MPKGFNIDANGLQVEVRYGGAAGDFISLTDIAKLPHVTLTLSEFENEWNDDLKGQFDSTRQFIRVF